MLKSKGKELIKLFAYSIILYIITYMMQHDNLLESVATFTFNLLYNIRYIIIGYLIMLSIFVVIKSLFKNLYITNAIIIAVVFIITIISYYKIKIIGQPFVPNDVFLIRNIGQISKFGLTLPSIFIILNVILLVFIFVAQLKLAKRHNTKNKITWKTDWYRIPTFILGLIIIFVLCISPKRFTYLNIESDLGNSYLWMGGNATFFIHLGDFYSVPPENYNKEYILKIKNKYINHHDEKVYNSIKPNVIIIMNESFSDPNKIKNVEYSKDPLSEIKQLLSYDSNCSMGYISTPVFGGGTSLPEFETLTGLSSYFLEKQIFPYNTYIHSDMNSIVRTYNHNNYLTVGLHTNTQSFYNRKNVYKFLGFQKTIFAEDIQNPEIKGEYISDNEFANQVIKEFENKNNSNIFIFGVTMQNHMPYKNKKYDHYDITIQSDYLTDAENMELKNYIQGVYDGDKMYSKLVEYLRTQNEPTVLLMFGDHLPTFESGEKIYSKIKYLDYYSTPYILWANYDIDNAYIKTRMSPSSLSISLLNLCNIELPWYLKTFEKLYNLYPSINNQFVIDAEGKIFEPKQIENTDLINDCRIIQYDLLIKKKYIDIN